MKCIKCNKEFIKNQNLIEAYKKFSPNINGKIYEIKYSGLCPDCYEQLRLSFRNKRNLYKRKCDMTGKDIISVYSPDKDLKVYDFKERWSDKWDALDYSVDYNKENSFFEQLNKLIKKVPYPNLIIYNCENCDYNDGLTNSKNAYMCFGNNELENAFYTEESMKITNSSDIWWSGMIEKSYECIDCSNLFNSRYCYHVSNSSNLVLCKKCYNCHDCFMCYGIQGKKYCILNKQYDKSEYEEKLKDLNLGDFNSIEKYKEIFQNFVLKQPQVCLAEDGNENCLGNYIYNSNNCYNCFNLISGNEAINLYEGGRISDVYDSSFVYDLEGPVIGSISVFDNSKNIYFSNYIYSNSFNIYYSQNLKNCSDCFACVGLVGKRFCILNKEYKQEDYYKKVDEIINKMIKYGEWGKPLPRALSLFGYNETGAQEYYPLSQKSAIKSGFNWLTYSQPFPKVQKIIQANKLPSNIRDIPNDILNRAIECNISKKSFKITKEELEFYKQNNIPIPRLHYDERYKYKMSLLNKRKLYNRECDKCGKDIKTVFSPKRKEIVYCQNCYDKEIFG